MILDPITRNKITNIVFTASEPTNTSVIWAKPNGDVVTLYVYKKGTWSKIPSEGIDELVKEYVDSQDALTLATAEKYSDNNLSFAKDYTDSSSKELTEKINKKVGTVEVKKSSTNDLLYTLYVDGQASGNITIPEDKFLKKVSYDSTTKKLTFIFNTEKGETTTTIDVSDLVDTYTAGNGLSLSGNKFSVVVSSDSESYLTITEKGIKLSGVTSALANKADKTSIPIKVSQLTNDSNYVTKTTADSTYAKATDLTSEVTRAKNAENTKLDKTATAASASKLATAHKINGVAFDGSKDVTDPFTSGLYESYLNWGGKGGPYNPIYGRLLPHSRFKSKQVCIRKTSRNHYRV